MLSCATRTAIAALLLLTALSVGGCVSSYVHEAQEEELRELDKIVVTSAEEVPAGSAADTSAEPVDSTSMADLTFRAYALDEDRVKELHAASGGEAGVRAGGVVGILAAEALLYPIIPLDLAAAAIIAARHETDKLGNRLIVLTHDAEGAYRWHLCCPKEDALTDKRYPLSLLASPHGINLKVGGDTSAKRKENRKRYAEDYWTLVCFEARAGDHNSQNALASASARGSNTERQIERYFWLKAMERAKPDVKRFKLDIYSLELDMEPETLEAARERVKGMPIGETDCRATGRLLA